MVVEATFWKMASGTRFAGWSSKAKLLLRSHGPNYAEGRTQGHSVHLYGSRSALCARPEDNGKRHHSLSWMDSDSPDIC